MADTYETMQNLILEMEKARAMERQRRQQEGMESVSPGPVDGDGEEPSLGVLTRWTEWMAARGMERVVLRVGRWEVAFNDGGSRS